MKLKPTPLARREPRRSSGENSPSCSSEPTSSRSRAGWASRGSGIKIQPAPLEVQEPHTEAFMALAHAGRLRVFFAIVKAGKEVTAGALQRQLNLPAPTLSHHLNLLRLAGLIQRRKEQRFVHYSARREMVTELVRLLTACC